MICLQCKVTCCSCKINCVNQTSFKEFFYKFMTYVANLHFLFIFSVAMIYQINRIYHHTVEGTRESHPSVHDLQSTTRLAESWMLHIMDTRMGFPCPFNNVVIDYFSPTPSVFNK